MPSLAIRHRLAAVAVFLLLPIGLLGYLFFAQADKEIRFSTKEVLGTSYIQALMPELVALARQDTASAPLPPNPALDAEMAANDGLMNTAAFSQAYRTLRDELGGGGHPAAARQAAATLVAKVGDGSNLILDPDLDSFYVMDTLVLKVPAAINAAPALVTRLTAAKFTPVLSDGDVATLVAELGAFRAAITGAADALVAAHAENPDGSVRRNLSAPLAGYIKAAETFGAAILAGRQALADPAARAALDLGPVAAAHQAFQDAALAYWQAAGSEMQRLLGQRVTSLETGLMTALAGAGALVALVLGLLWIVARSIVNGIARLEADIRRLADEGGASEIAHADGRDELASVARAVAHLRDRTVARLGEADGLKQQEQRSAEQARAAADDERQRSEAAQRAQAENQRQAVVLLGEGLKRLASGDLTSRIDTPFEGDLDGLRVALNESVEHVAQIMTRLRGTSRTLKIATGELLAGTNDLSDRTSRQATTIDEISAAIEQLSGTVLANADRASSASDTAGRVTAAAEESGAVMHKANAAMERITASSDKIAKIVGLIDDIAFQTNLLALNASVEAARAGEAGKGFAVVAVEVRRLAQSAAEANKDIKVLIEESVGEVEGGTRLVADAAARLTDMLESARASTELMETIARDSRSQASSIGEVNEAVRLMHEMTQHNASLVEQTNAAIEQTESQASELDRIVEVFTQGGEEQPASKTAVRPGPGAAAGELPRGAPARQAEVRRAAKSYLRQGNAALDSEWAEF